MSTAKHLILTERPGTNIEIVNVNGRPAIIVTDNYKSTMAYFEPADGAKTALAILEAAGTPMNMDTYLGVALRNLDIHVSEQAHLEETARENALLEAEALDFLNVSRKAKHLGPLGNFDDHTKDAWLAVARKAREMAERAEK